jgi:predicted nuclease of predicted toxin-antitoxin system
VTFLIDAQLPPALASWLIQQGHTAQHVDDLGLRNADDMVIWNHASESGAIVITKDEDFAERTARTKTGPVMSGFASATPQIASSLNGCRRDGTK